MSEPKLEITGITVVLVGSFNPAIFQPAWFVAEALIRPQEGETAHIEVIHPKVTSFSIPDWLTLEVTEDRFIASTTQEPSFGALRDLIVGTFDLLRHTPVKQMGINRDFHFLMDTEDEWHAIGNRLAPKELWRDIIKNPGMRKLMIQGERPDSFRGALNVIVEPSDRVKPGVYVRVNDHYEVENADTLRGCSEIISILLGVWELSLIRASEIGKVVLRARNG